MPLVHQIPNRDDHQDAGLIPQQDFDRHDGFAGPGGHHNHAAAAGLLKGIGRLGLIGPQRQRPSVGQTGGGGILTDRPVPWSRSVASQPIPQRRGVHRIAPVAPGAAVAGERQSCRQGIGP